MPSKKRKGVAERTTIHPRNKYSEKLPNFGVLASLYRSFEPYVFYSSMAIPELTGLITMPPVSPPGLYSSMIMASTGSIMCWILWVIVLERNEKNGGGARKCKDSGLNDWWIPDGQLCPTVPNRSNYIHWIEDLLASDLILESRADDDVIKGFDIGTGANCIYPLLGASLLGWRLLVQVLPMFVLLLFPIPESHLMIQIMIPCKFLPTLSADVTDVAVEWAERNVRNNPHISGLIEVRKVPTEKKSFDEEGVHAQQGRDGGGIGELGDMGVAEIGPSCLSSVELQSLVQKIYHASPILLGVVKDGEKFDFCVGNPPFFETMEEAGLNPKTACGRTKEEMVCEGGE